MNQSPTLENVRLHLLNTLADLRNPEAPMEIDRARAVAQVAGVLVDTARVEVDYIKACGGKDSSNFLESGATQEGAPALTKEQAPKELLHQPTAHNPFPGRRTER
jgi:ribosomal protein L12E/L44/L45/RPP1/RPP2